MQNKGPIKGSDGKKKANGRRKGTLHGQKILTLTKMGSLIGSTIFVFHSMIVNKNRI